MAAWGFLIIFIIGFLARGAEAGRKDKTQNIPTVWAWEYDVCVIWRYLRENRTAARFMCLGWAFLIGGIVLFYCA